jgi:hypothetical protein
VWLLHIMYRLSFFGFDIDLQGEHFPPTEFEQFSNQ